MMLLIRLGRCCVMVGSSIGSRFCKVMIIDFDIVRLLFLGGFGF